jgi:predicted Rossmann fold nucleotide-binding protein DprA/Smf involved in DNA uptake
VVIVEAGATSGALHAARSAHLQGRPVFAVNNSDGNAQLLREFALELPPTAEELIELVKRYEIVQGSRIDGKSH